VPVVNFHPLVLVICLHSYADVPRHELQPALDQTARAFRAVGVRTEWRDGPAGQWSTRTCEFTLLLLSGEMTAHKSLVDHIDSRVLGSSAPSARRAWIFIDRVAAVSAQAGLKLSDLLGQVITHELGHLLLPDDVDAIGIMREHLQITGAGSFRFTRSQGEQMRRRLGDPVALLARDQPRRR
jgi:hypothetical protein